jgi:hypothetical protein
LTNPTTPFLTSDPNLQTLTGFILPNQLQQLRIDMSMVQLLPLRLTNRLKIQLLCTMECQCPILCIPDYWPR